MHRLKKEPTVTFGQVGEADGSAFGRVERAGLFGGKAFGLRDLGHNVGCDGKKGVEKAERER